MRERGNLGGYNLRKESRWNWLSGDHFISTQLIPNHLFAHPRAEKELEPIPHALGEKGCAISAMVNTFMNDEKRKV
jgi:hypothetical protein